MGRLKYYGPSLVVLIAAACVLWGGPAAVRSIGYANTRHEIEQASIRLNQGTLLEQLNSAYQDIAAVVEPSVVHISASQGYQDRSGRIRNLASSGSGWLYDDLGHVVTNYHVVADAEHIEVQLHNGDLRRAEVKGRDKNTDIAVLKIAPDFVIPATLGSSKELKQGDQVFAFGSPFEFRFSMSKGIVSGLGRHAGLSDITYEDFIQVDAAINPGNSGGPLTDIDGHVVGMNTAIATGSGTHLGQGQSAGIGLAIPISMIKSVVDQLIATGEVAKGYLGVSGIGSERQLNVARSLGFRGQGFAIPEVGAGTPADLAGLRKGDVITHVDDRPVDSFERLRTFIGSRIPGERVRLTVWRADELDGIGSTVNTSITLGEFGPGVYARETVQLLAAQGLIEFSTSTKQRTSQLKIPFQSGVIVERINAQAPARLEVPPFSIIQEVNSWPVVNVDEFYDRVDEARRFLRAARISYVTPEGQSGVVTLDLRN